MADLIIVGAGLAGLSCGVRATELSLEPLVLEKTSLDPSWSNSRVSAGVFHLARLGLDSRVERIVDKLTKETEGAGRAGLLEAFAQDSLPAVQWLQAQGVEVKPDANQRYVLQPPPQGRASLVWQDGGSDRALRRLRDRLVAGGGSLRNNCRVSRLLTQDRGVNGVVTKDGSSFEAQAVVLAEGGFQANRELVNRYIGPQVFDQVKLRAVDSGTGDGMLMAEEIGAKLANMESFYGHILSLDALHDDRLWPNPYVDGIVKHGMVVWRPSGQRFVDESWSGVTIANVIARSGHARDAMLIFDSVAWEGPARQGAEGSVAGNASTPNPGLVNNGATVHHAASWPELARLAGIDPAALATTVEDFNRAAAADISPSGTPRTRPYRAVDTPPFYAIPLVPGMTHTMGGVLTDEDGRALNRDEQPIPGLWAAGATAAGLDGGPKAGYAGGLLAALVFGKRAAESISRTLKENDHVTHP